MRCPETLDHRHTFLTTWPSWPLRIRCVKGITAISTGWPDSMTQDIAEPSPHPIETILGVALKRLLFLAIPWSLINLIFGPGEDPYLYVNLQLTLLQIATFSLMIHLAPLTDRPWFRTSRRPWLASAVSLVAVAVGFSALLTLATSAAARYDVSLQFLQLLSSLDIAWVVAALYLGSRILWSDRVALVLGSLMLIACVASIAIYLSVVGFTPEGGWLVDGGELLRIVLPSDVMAAIISTSVLLLGSRKAQEMLQARPQS